MTGTTLRLRRIALRALVLVQAALVALVAYSAAELVGFGAAVLPGVVFLCVSMLAATAVAMRATFRRSKGTRGHRLAFLTAEAYVALAPVLGSASLVPIVAPGSALPPNPVFGPEFLVHMMALELLAAACLAGVAAMLAPLLLPPPADSTPASPFARELTPWAATAVLASVLVGAGYGAGFSRDNSPAVRLQQLFAATDADEQRSVARILATLDLSGAPEVRGELFGMLSASGSVERAWAAYVLVASGSDDGRAMQTLRQMVDSHGVGRAVVSLAMLGPAAAPAVPELTRLLDEEPTDPLVAGIEEEAARALGNVGPAATSAIPALVERAQAAQFPELRFAAGLAIDRIDATFAERCTESGRKSVVDALVDVHPGQLAILPGCAKPTVAASS